MAVTRISLPSGADASLRLGRMIVAYTYEGKPVTAHDLKAEGAMAALDRHSTAIISLATVISKPSSRGTPCILPPL